MTLQVLPQSRSMGSPNRGRLAQGREFPKEGPGWFRFSPNAWGTDETVTLLQWALEEWHRTFPDAPPVAVGALSREGGGRLRPHKSHQSGRDVDMGLVPADGQARKGFVPLPKSGLDFRKTVHLMALLVSTGRVQAIFIHRSLIPGLRQAAEEEGFSPDLMARLFGGAGRPGVVTAWKGHRAHYHVRFTCPAGDPSCHEEAVRLAPKVRATAQKKASPAKGTISKKSQKASGPSRKVLTNAPSRGKAGPARSPDSRSREGRRRY
ncbi:MAG TPA: penicillin-insensitive murein endopeptidase [Myxococcota bacterium]|nr:penicillin-insensitive murein endopeptidase [Myxococcota bacterium]HQK52407.1 penicillin-insensitive murein endopeptidase [Myxococcota bacterium]